MESAFQQTTNKTMTPALMSFADVEELQTLRKVSAHRRASNRQMVVTLMMLAAAVGLFFGGALGALL